MAFQNELCERLIWGYRGGCAWLLFGSSSLCITVSAALTSWLIGNGVLGITISSTLLAGSVLAGFRIRGGHFGPPLRDSSEHRVGWLHLSPMAAPTEMLHRIFEVIRLARRYHGSVLTLSDVTPGVPRS